MKILIVAAVAVFGLSGCIAVPVPIHSGQAHYYPAPAVGVGIYAAPGYGRPHPRQHRQYPRHGW